MNISGTWSGFYFDPAHGHSLDSISSDRHAFPIRAVIEQDGEHFGGEMFDEISETSETYATALNDYPGEMSVKDKKLTDRFLLLYPDARVHTKLPERSLIAGTVKGREISFGKWYQGEHLIEVEVEKGTRATTMRAPDHQVFYKGMLNQDGNSIEGTWVVRRPGFLGKFLKPNNQGTFRLERITPE